MKPGASQASQLADATHLWHFILSRSVIFTTATFQNTMKRIILFRRSVLLSVLTAALWGCVIPISQKTSFPLDVFYDNETPERPYSEIQWLEISREDALRSAQTKKEEKRMLERGNNIEAKNLMTAQLVMKAQTIGADALVNVNYQYYTGKDYEGYSMRGLAVRYRGD